ncbi:MAG: hypothetical protein AMXMBFR23_06310 [Chloroflexota bacterium]
MVPAALAILGVLVLSAFAPAGPWRDTWEASASATERARAGAYASTHHLREAARTEAFREGLAASSGIGAAGALLAVTLGLPASALIARRPFTGIGVLRTALLLPLALPPLAVALGLRRVAGTEGWLALDPGVAAVSVVVATHALYGVALATWLCGDAWSRVNARSTEAARILGGRPWGAWRATVWPVIRPAVRAVAALTFASGFVSVVAILVAGDGRLSTLDTLVAGDGVVAHLAVYGLVNAAVLGVATRFAWPRPRGRQYPVRTLRGLPLAAGWLAALTVVAVTVASFLGLAAGAVTPAEADVAPVDVFVGLFEPVASGGAREPLLRSVVYAAAATTGAVLLAASAARIVRSGDRGVRGLARAALLVPAVLAPASVALALREALSLRSEPALVAGVAVLLAFPLALRVAASVPLEGSTASDAARLLGASRFGAWRTLRLRASLPALVAAAGVTLAFALGEAAATPRLVAGGDETLAVRALREATSPGTPASAYAAALLLAMPGALLFLGSWRWWRSASGGRQG